MNHQDETLYKIFLEKTHYGLVFKVEGASFRVIVVGDRYLKLTGLDRQGLMAVALNDMPAQLFPPATMKAFEDVVKSAQVVNIRSFQHPTMLPPHQINVGVQITPLFDNNQQVSYLLYEICDVDVDVKITDVLVKEESRKNDFISMVSHELKTPLTSLKAYVQLLSMKAKQSNDQFAIRSLGKVDAQVNKMNKMIRSFLDLSRLESGQILLEKEVFIIDQLLGEIVEEVSITDKSHTILFSACKPFEVKADREKIGQVINNLLSNAIKYSSMHSKITIRCVLIDQEVQVSVSDEGIGVAKVDIKKIFSRFYRVKNKLLKTVSGFGIGLYLSAEIIKAHGGKIWVESEEGKGSVFHFSLPV